MHNSLLINRIMYGSFCFMGAYTSIFNHDFFQAAAFLGIALAFDPFDQTVTWKDRSIFQKGLLIGHVCLILLMLLLGWLK